MNFLNSNMVNLYHYFVIIRINEDQELRNREFCRILCKYSLSENKLKNRII